MPSEEAERIIAELRAQKALPRAPLEARRAGWHEAARATPLPEGTRIEKLRVGNVPCERVRLGEPNPERHLIWLHGGGYVSGSCVTHRELAARASLLCGANVLVVDYRLAPEHPFPAATDDAFAVYRGLLSQGVDPSQLAVCGDSAGGGLAVAVMLSAREAGLSMPAAAVLLSPWLDLDIALPSGTENAEADPSIVRENLLECARQYVADADRKHPLASPVHADPRGLPPLYVNVGDLEVLFDEALAFADRARDVGVETRVSIGEGLWHVYPAWSSSVPEAMTELESVAAWLRERLA